MAKFSTLDAADYLDNKETIAEYITAALEDPNPDVFLDYRARRGPCPQHGPAPKRMSGRE